MAAEPRTVSDEELTDLARKLSLAVLAFCAERRISASDTATMIAVAAAEVHCQCHGPSGIVHLRNAVDVCERQVLEMMN
jgi:hypothetical protein